jgi:hypothetical protein
MRIVGFAVCVAITITLFQLVVFDRCAKAADQFHGIGANKFDLVEQYLGLEDGGNGTPAYEIAETEIAEKAIKDAAYAHIPFFRVAVTGFAPSDLDLWVRHPQTYWHHVDRMMSDLHQAHIKLVANLMFNAEQFPSYTHENLGDLVNNAQSKSWLLLKQYIEEFISRYKDSGDIFFYEMTNELNLRADINAVADCSRKRAAALCQATSNILSAQTVAFTRRMYDLIKGLDSAHLVSTGFSFPRASAQHLRVHPGTKNSQGDWTPDTDIETIENLEYMNQNADIMSVHIYPTNLIGDIRRTIQIAKNASNAASKPLFIGEFGTSAPNSTEGGQFLRDMIREIIRSNVSYSAFWDWEVYPQKRLLAKDMDKAPFNIDPSLTPNAVTYIEAADRDAEEGSLFSSSVPGSPTVAITSPMVCHQPHFPLTVYVMANSQDHDISSVKLYLENRLVGTTSSVPYHFIIASDEAPDGLFHLTATAVTRLGESAESHLTCD